MQEKQDKFEDGSVFIVNYDKILDSKSIPTSVKLAVFKGKEKGYLSFEEFLRTITDNEVAELGNIFEVANETQDTKNEVVMTAFAIAATLAQLEGAFIETNEQLVDYFRTTSIGVSLEGLSRKGLVEINRQALGFIVYDENVSLVKLTDKGRDFTNKLKGKGDV